ncbi:hypothetical protein [Acidithiobacillus thiooxidans]|uniref:hypothetical protein n=1 Tax=Acidithiobacillus thiooxidans TaxID=930 RepID=UPI0004B4F332|nr:hypothetical protein [Acidithiobacillus thiooxidans]MDX5935417.1 hypothetical protein [Acidithiobacillus thiooxidans]
MASLLERLNGAPEKGATPYPKLTKEMQQCAYSLERMVTRPDWRAQHPLRKPKHVLSHLPPMF